MPELICCDEGLVLETSASQSSVCVCVCVFAGNCPHQLSSCLLYNFSYNMVWEIMTMMMVMKQ